MATSILENIKKGFDQEDSDLVLEIPKKKEELVLPIEEAPECVLKPLSSGKLYKESPIVT